MSQCGDHEPPLIDTNAFAVLLGRVLDKVCLDRNARGVLGGSTRLMLKGFNMSQNTYDYATRKGVHPISS
jgi:hypothetical protein